MGADCQFYTVIKHCHDGKDQTEEDILGHHGEEAVTLHFRIKPVHQAEQHRGKQDR